MPRTCMIHQGNGGRILDLIDAVASATRRPAMSQSVTSAPTGGGGGGGGDDDHDDSV